MHTTMHNLWQDILRFADGMTTQHWILLGVAAIVLGLFCLRGFGSRSHY